MQPCYVIPASAADGNSALRQLTASGDWTPGDRKRAVASRKAVFLPVKAIAISVPELSSRERMVANPWRETGCDDLLYLILGFDNRPGE
jgi:hypothetical protein